MKNKTIKRILIGTVVLLSSPSFAQELDTVASSCVKHLERKFISDGQQYRSLLVNTEETAEFRATFFGGTVYRVAACSGLSDGNLLFWVYDKERNLLFTNKDVEAAPYWDFKITNTIDCIIEARLNGATGAASGRAVVLIGFKK
jgi:hypothetical protein